MTLPRITVILATHNTPPKRFRRVLEAIRNNTDVPYELVMVDTSRTSAVISRLANRFRARLIRPAVDRGLGASWNIGAQIATAPALALICDDVYVEPNWASAGIRHLRGNVKILSGKLFATDNENILNAAGSYTDVFGVSWNRGIGERDCGHYDKAERVFRAVGAVFMVQRHAFNEVGRFDESYFLYAEDMDISWRLRLAGYDCMFVPEMRALHEWMASTSKANIPFVQYHYLLERNRLQTLLKNYSGRTLLSIMPWYILIKIVHLVWLGAHKQAAEARQLLKAFLWIARNRREIVRKRCLAQKLRRREDREIQELMLKLPAELLLGLGFYKHPLVEAVRRRRS